ncbi:hypothetical protein [Streptomyces sp. Ag109_O5-10]|uniref:hypothetical protein n=1 Tax=Streptomyces sp. Ag109_O5-10 TaxID=1855349 RepID=UPI0015A6703C|nr:hypothetical protein [Streptomyces sp. Ag109_O5-10]
MRPGRADRRPQWRFCSYVTSNVGALDAVRQIDAVPVLRRVEQAGTRLHDGRPVPA